MFTSRASQSVLSHIPNRRSVLGRSTEALSTHEDVRGYDFEAGLPHCFLYLLIIPHHPAGIDYAGIMRSMRTTGYQATNLGLAIEEVAASARVRLVVTRAAQVNKMLHWRLSDEPVTDQERDLDGNVDLEARKQVGC
jgi:hypothetical protein